MKKTLFALIVFIWFGNVVAYATEAIPTKRIEEALKSYINMIGGCLVKFDRTNIVKEEKEGTFLVFYDIDATCSGGTRMYEPAFAVMGYNYKKQIRIIPEQSFPAAKLLGFPQNIYKIYLKNKELWYSGKEYGPKDANCCPSIPVESRFFLERETFLNSRNATGIDARYGYELGIESLYWIDSRIIRTLPSKSLMGTGLKDSP